MSRQPNKPAAPSWRQLFAVLCGLNACLARAALLGTQLSIFAETMEPPSASPPAGAVCAGDGAAGDWVTAVYGGSFSPFHVGHEQVVRRLCQLKDVRRVVVVPAGRSPGRSAAAAAATQMPWQLRFELAQAVFSTEEPPVGGCEIMVCRPSCLIQLYIGCFIQLACCMTC